LLHNTEPPALLTHTDLSYLIFEIRDLALFVF